MQNITTQPTPPLHITPEQLLAYHKQACELMRADIEIKNANYSHSEHGYNNAFANFNRVEQKGLLSAEKGILNRISDKDGRLISFVNGGSITPEKAVSDCREAANYFIILAAMIEARAKQDRQTNEASVRCEKDCNINTTEPYRHSIVYLAQKLINIGENPEAVLRRAISEHTQHLGIKPLTDSDKKQQAEIDAEREASIEKGPDHEAEIEHTAHAGIKLKDLRLWNTQNGIGSAWL